MNKNIQTIPSGCVHLVFHRGCDMLFSNGEKQPKNFIRGQLSAPGTLLFSGNIDMIAIVFHPLGIIPFLSHPASELYNHYIDIDDLGNAGLINLERFIANEEDISTCIQEIEKCLIGRLNNASNYNYNRILRSIQLIKNEAQLNVSELADNACLGYRHFKRIFTQYTGVSPKEYIRIIRFQKVLHILQNNPTLDITKVAYICGYYDHSHLVKDFRSLSGCSPTEYLASRKPHSTFFSNDCRINLIRSN
ncbi:MAG: helix-turn-helix domain-containing protein [Tannerella sp.]|nr:helix-turn-helix domain-containing protein [Tannerella sp.]